MGLSLKKINISHFRCYDAARIDLSKDNNNIVVLTGTNGSGKTNILEALSLLVPGKGLRNADILEMKNCTSSPEDVWTVSAEVQTSDGMNMRIGTGMDRKKAEDQSLRRIVRINGKDAKTQNELSPFISAVWLTPQMDRLFQEGPSARRKFLDRLVFAYEPSHVTQVNRYDKKLRERMKLLQSDQKIDSKWLDTLETQIAAEAVSIAAARITLIEHLQQDINHLPGLFPHPKLEIKGWVEENITTRTAINVEDDLKEKLKNNRSLDRDMRRTQEGTHRSDLKVTYIDKNMAADQCSTGEQKALLVSIILAHAIMMQHEKGFTPLILLDEVAAHLDEKRRSELFNLLTSLNGQVWLTGTDEAIFLPLKEKAQFFKIQDGRIITAPQLQKMATS